MATTSLPACRFRDEGDAPDTYRCRSPKVVAAGPVPASVCATCPFADAAGDRPRLTDESRAALQALQALQARNRLPPARADCAHLGPATGEVRECKSCNLPVARHEVRRCARHGLTTLAGTFGDIAGCKSCDDYQAPQPPPDAAAWHRGEFQRRAKERPACLMLRPLDWAQGDYDTRTRCERCDNWPRRGDLGKAEEYALGEGGVCEHLGVGPHARPTVRDVLRGKADRPANCPPAFPEGRGVVTAAGGDKYFAGAWVVLRMLRHLGCELPVEVWHLGPAEMDPEMRRLLESECGDVRVVDAHEVVKSLPEPPATLNGWELKPFAVIHSRFAEVLFLDADCVPVLDPTFLFDDPAYQNAGAVFWPDLPPNDRREWVPRVVWENCGMPYRNEPDFESGQLLVDKRRCWPALQLCMWMNETSGYWYKQVYGDKTTWHLSWRGTGTDYAMPTRAAGWVHPAILQYAPDGRLCFLHCCQGKELLAKPERLPNNLPLADKIEDAGRVLRTHWRGRVWDWRDQSPDEHALARSIPGRYHYRRDCDAGGRTLTLLPGGAVGEGKAACEKRWTLRLLGGVATLVVTGEAHKGTEIGMMFLRQDATGAWRGRWEAHERSPVSLTPLVPREPPPGWLTRPGTWDRNIWDCVARDNEYGLPAAFAPGDVVVDVGAHAGAFALACLARGAGRVVCVEPEADNWRMLWANLAPWRDRVECHRAACWPGGGPVSLVDPAPGHANTGRWETRELDAGPAGAGGVPSVDIDDLLAAAGRVRLLKLDCEHAEWAILSFARRLPLCDEVVGEYHLRPGATHDDFAELRRTLEWHGFAVTSSPTSDTTGRFRARRPT